MDERPLSVDSHCHLNMLANWHQQSPPDSLAAAKEIEEIVRRARIVGVTQQLVPGCSWEDFPGIVTIAERFDDVWAAFGIHPHDARTWAGDSAPRLKEALRHTRAVAVGECGLDYHYDLSSRDSQKEAFRAQIRLALDVRKPVIIHTREAEQDTLRLITEENAAAVGGVIHCFTGTAEMAESCLDLGFYISFSGILAFPRSTELRSIAKTVPLCRTLAETDSPFLAPPPYRGKRNEPAFLTRVIETLAEIHEVAYEAVASATAQNAQALFGLPKWRDSSRV